MYIPQVFSILISLFFGSCNLIQIVLNIVLSYRGLIVSLIPAVLKLGFAGFQHSLSLSILLFLRQRALIGAHVTLVVVGCSDVTEFFITYVEISCSQIRYLHSLILCVFDIVSSTS